MGAPMPEMSEAQREAAMRNFERKVRIQERLKNIRQIVAVMSGKGGVGKSTVAVNLATALAEKGHTVGLLDVDVTNPNTPTMFGVRGRNLEAASKDTVSPMATEAGVKLVSTGLLAETNKAIVWRGPLKMHAIQQLIADVEWGDLDYLIVDLPPGTSDEALTVAQTMPKGSHAVIVTSPQDVSLEDAARNIAFANTTGLNVLGVVENFSYLAAEGVPEGFKVFPGRGADLLAEEADVPVLARIPLDPQVAAMGDAGTIPVQDLPDSPTSRALAGLADEVEARLQQA